MKKHILLLLLLATNTSLLLAQKKEQPYPTPEFMNEIYSLKKDSGTLKRLEKEETNMETSTRLGGMGGVEVGYALKGDKSRVRLNGNSNSFVFYLGEPAGNKEQTDSMLRANGMDPASMPSFSGGMNTDPTSTTTLYKLITDKGNRKVIIQSAQGMKLISKKTKESNKYSFSVKKVKEGYYEFQIDQPLPNGEYAFVVTAMPGAMSSVKVFAFGVDD